MRWQKCQLTITRFSKDVDKDIHSMLILAVFGCSATTATETAKYSDLPMPLTRWQGPGWWSQVTWPTLIKFLQRTCGNFVVIWHFPPSWSTSLTSMNAFDKRSQRKREGVWLSEIWRRRERGTKGREEEKGEREEEGGQGERDRSKER